MARPAPGSDARAREPVSQLCTVVLWMAVAVYVATVGSLAFHRHARLGSAAFDLGIFDQGVWLISQGRTPFVSTRGLHILADHFSPILYLLAPVYGVWPDPRALLLVQTAVTALGAVPLYCLALARLRSAPTALAAAGAYLAYGPLHAVNLFDFHPDGFVPTLVLAAIWFLEARRPGAYALAVVLLLACKESMGLVVVGLGAYGFATGHRRVGLATGVAGVLGAAIAFHTLARLNHGAPSQYLCFYAGWGDSPWQVITGVVTSPLQVLDHIAAADRVAYVVSLLLPVAFMALAAPECLLPALPAFMANALSSRPAMQSVECHYQAPIVPFVLLATVHGVQHLMALAPGPGRLATAVRTAPVVALVVGTAVGVARGPLPAARASWPVSQYQARAAAATLRAVPPDASVCAQAAVAAHLTHRPRLYVLPNPFQRCAWGNSREAMAQQAGARYAPLPEAELRRRIAAADVEYVVLGPAATSPFPLEQDGYAAICRALLTDRHYAAVAVGGDVVVLRRGADRERGRALLARAAVAPCRNVLQAAGLAPFYFQW